MSDLAVVGSGMRGLWFMYFGHEDWHKYLRYLCQFFSGKHQTVSKTIHLWYQPHYRACIYLHNPWVWLLTTHVWCSVTSISHGVSNVSIVFSNVLHTLADLMGKVWLGRWGGGRHGDRGVGGSHKEGTQRLTLRLWKLTLSLGCTWLHILCLSTYIILGITPT